MYSDLLKWSHENFGHLPWRKNRTLYTTLISEVMLQQTTVTAVEKYFTGFIKSYPSPKRLAPLTESEILVAWKGLGYYRRAKNLLKTCQDLMEKFKGRFPNTREELMSLHGIGPYTSSALTAIGRDEVELALDANLERVLSRIYVISDKAGLPLQKKLRALFLDKKILPGLKVIGPRKLHEALMDLGRVHCQSQRTSCHLCPMKQNCQAFKLGRPLDFPVRDVKKIMSLTKIELLRVLVRKGKKILVYQKRPGEWLSGQYELPTFVLQSDEALDHQYPKMNEKFRSLFSKHVSFKTGITRYNIQNIVWASNKSEFDKIAGKNLRFQFVDENLIVQHLSTASLKALNSYKKGLEEKI